MVKSNKMNWKSILLLAGIISITSPLFAGGPWPQSRGNGYFKLYQWWTVFDQHYTDTGELDPNVTTGVFNTSLYAEYGLTDRFTGILNAPLFSRNYMNNLISSTTGETLVEGEAINSIGDIDLGIKYGLTKPGSKFPVAATLMLGIPSGKTAGGSQENLQTGDGEFNQFIRVDAGTSFKIGKQTNAYTSLYTGFNNRGNDFSEEVRFGLEAGAGLLNSKLWLIGRLDVVESLKNGATAATVNSTSIFANNTEFSSYSLEAAYYITPKIGVSASVAAAFRGEIIAAAPSYSVGIFLDLKK